jgi:hypothetical protein
MLDESWNPALRCWMKVGNLCFDKCDQSDLLSDWSTGGGMLSQLRVAVVAAVVTSAASQITVAGTSSRNGAVIDALWNRPLNVSHELKARGLFRQLKRIHSIQNPPHTLTHLLRLPQPLVGPGDYGRLRHNLWPGRWCAPFHDVVSQALGLAWRPSQSWRRFYNAQECKR